MERQITRTFRVQKMKIKDLKGKYGFANRESTDYDWESLEASIKEDGYAPEKYTYIEYADVRHDQGFKQDYMLVDGAHRLAVLNDLYGEDIEIRVKIEEIDTIDGKKFIRPDSEDYSCPHCQEPLKGCKCKIAKADDGFDVHSKCRIPYNNNMKKRRAIVEAQIKKIEEEREKEFEANAKASGRKWVHHTSKPKNPKI